MYKSVDKSNQSVLGLCIFTQYVHKPVDNLFYAVAVWKYRRLEVKPSRSKAV